MKHKLSRILLVVVTVSVALNLVLLVTRSRGSKPKPSAHPAQRSTPRPDCCKGLARCQGQRFTAALSALRGKGLSRSPNRPVAPASLTPRPAVGTDAIGLADQQAALCDVAKQQLRRGWTKHSERLAKSLRKSLADAADQQRGLTREVKRFGDALTLTPADRDRLETHYEPLRKKRISEALSALEKDPPEWEGVHRAARALWRDQDRLTQELFGSPAVKKLRHAELRPRTTILALVAAQAGLDWDEGIRW